MSLGADLWRIGIMSSLIPNDRYIGWLEDSDLYIGRDIVAHLDREQECRWASMIIDFARVNIYTEPLIDSIADAARTPSKWISAKESLVRLRHNMGNSSDQGLFAMRLLADRVAKVVYNATGRRDGFDTNSSWHLPQDLRRAIIVNEKSHLAHDAWRLITRPVDSSEG